MQVRLYLHAFAFFFTLTCCEASELGAEVGREASELAAEVHREASELATELAAEVRRKAS